MAGTKAGGLKASAKNLEKYGKDFYRNIGRKGGSVSHPLTRPFATDRGLARVAGAKGGRISKRTKAE